MTVPHETRPENQPESRNSRSIMQQILLRDSVSLVDSGSEQPSGATRKPDGDSVMRLEWDEAGNMTTTIIDAVD